MDLGPGQDHWPEIPDRTERLPQGEEHNKIRPITISAGWMEMEMENGNGNGNGNGGMGMHPSLSLYLWHIKLLNQSPRRSPRRRRRRSSTAGQTNRSTYTESEINDNC